MDWTKSMLTIFFLIWNNQQVLFVSGHGRMMDPPSRNCMWRFGYPTPVNYDDTQLWCGNAATLEMNGGKCGVCGDNYADSEPREHEAGGKYGLGVIVKRYSMGQTLETEIDLTANHKGYFEFRICPVPDHTKEVTQECLDQNRLKVVDENGNLHESYVILTEDKSSTLTIKLQLPRDLSCSQCVLQWTYIAANTWGTCPNGTEAVGCGPQETFKNCADVAVLANTGGRPPMVNQEPPKNMVLVRDIKNGNLIPLVVRTQVCKGNGSYESQPGINEWCQENCMRYPPNCPEDKCKCLDTCDAEESFKQQGGSDAYCLDKCLIYPGKNCDTSKCKCY